MFARRDIVKGEHVCEYKGELCTYKVFKERHRKYDMAGKGSYILEFKYREQRWAIDATKDDNSVGRLINHSKRFPNIKPQVADKRGKPYVYFVAISDIPEDCELLYDYGDKDRDAIQSFPWLRQ